MKEEVSGLVQEADELMGGAKGVLVGFDVVRTCVWLIGRVGVYPHQHPDP